jgi:hypothetical protein
MVRFGLVLKVEFFIFVSKNSGHYSHGAPERYGRRGTTAMVFSQDSGCAVRAPDWRDAPSSSDKLATIPAVDQEAAVRELIRTLIRNLQPGPKP